MTDPTIVPIVHIKTTKECADFLAKHSDGVKCVLNWRDEDGVYHAWKPQDWQPIETAPKDGTLFLAYFPNGSPPMEVINYASVLNIAEMGPGDAPTRWAPLPPPPNFTLKRVAVHDEGGNAVGSAEDDGVSRSVASNPDWPQDD